MVPGPRPSDDLDGPASPDAVPVRPEGPGCPLGDDRPRIALTRVTRGWVVVPLPAGVVAGDPVDGLVEGMTLADLVADELGAPPEPDRTARRSARGPAGAPADTDPVDARIAALERTVAQLEHALASRVSTERAIGVLAERQGCSLRAAFEGLRRAARTQGRPVVDLAREVLEGLVPDAAAPPAPITSPPAPAPAPVLRPVPVPTGAVATADGRS
ncbi:ANTAR domain-containing protein [Blastococcus sp. VKM Ac-2987]|uniref:ANTAR domain-containing protein n=1 Tax=Blastococcus sp. VKM Ac-2987 TaxID=3004141 RepID=UPI0022AB8382|nr:ANTAR domain-containing protein [Blastococcus sp. VKM Ac-2987]MCZ2859639.1 ANTAR domain-containing protein [Blastococcus sp. VKM Ac-2987]